MRAVRFFARRRTKAPPAGPGCDPADDALVRSAERIVRAAWLRDLQELRQLAERRLGTAVADGVEAYEKLRRAQRHSDFQEVVEAQVAFDAATRLALARFRARDRLDVLAQAETGPGRCGAPPAGESASGSTGWIARIVAGLSKAAGRAKRE
jgi:hypothetical protein